MGSWGSRPAPDEQPGVGRLFAFPQKFISVGSERPGDDFFRRRGAFLRSAKQSRRPIMPLQLDYFYGGEAEQYSFYRIPNTRPRVSITTWPRGSLAAERPQS